MQITAITQARLVALIQVQEWDPFGKSLTMEAIDQIRARYTFARVPTRLEEIDLQKGIELAEGVLGEIKIDRIAIFSNGVIIDTRSGTDNSEAVLRDLIQTAHDAFGARIAPARVGFTSQFMFQSDLELSALHPSLEGFSSRLSSSVSADLKHQFVFEPTTILFSVDTSQAKTAPASFSIERRVDVPFSEKTYFTSAPLRTQEHVEVVQAFEATLLKQQSGLQP